MISRLLRLISTSTRRELVVTGLLAFTLFWSGAGAPPLIGRDEPRFAQAAREMLDRGDLVVPTFGGQNRYDKPILIYWCTMASYRLLGVNEQAARLPSNVAAALAAMLLAWAARRRYGPGAGAVAGLLLAVTVTFHIEARGCTADAVMLLPGLAALIALVELWHGRGGRGYAAILWLGLALGMLAKGPVVPAFALAMVLTWWGMTRTWHRWEIWAAGILLVLGWWRLGPLVLALPAAVAVIELLAQAHTRRRLAALRWWWGVPLLLVIVLPWAIAAYHATDGAFFEVGVGRHVVARSLTALESHGGFPGFYAITGPLAAFPWFLLLIPVARVLVRAWPVDSETRMLAAWVVGPLVMLELVQTKLVHYWMLSYPAAILLILAWLTRSLGRGPDCIPDCGEEDDEPSISPAIRWSIAASAVLLALVPLILETRLELEQLHVAAIATALPLLLGAIHIGARGGASPLRCMITLSLGTGVFLVVLLSLFLPALAPSLLGPRAAARALELVQPSEQLVVYKARDDELFFYLPLEAISCRPRTCLEKLIESGEPLLGIGRTADVERLADEDPRIDVVPVDTVEGIELGRVRWSRITLFRPAVADLVSLDNAGPLQEPPDGAETGFPPDQDPPDQGPPDQGAARGSGQGDR